MTSKAFVYAAAVAALSFGSLSFAQDFNRRGQHAEPQRFEQHAPAHRHMHGNRGFESRQFDRYDTRRDRRLGVHTVCPADNGAVGLEGAGMMESGRNCRHPRERGRNCRNGRSRCKRS